MERKTNVTAAVALLLCACAAAQMKPYDSPYLTYQHGTAMFATANDYAQAYCGQAGRHARHLGTDTPSGPMSMSLSRFECVPR